MKDHEEVKSPEDTVSTGSSAYVSSTTENDNGVVSGVSTDVGTEDVNSTESTRDNTGATTGETTSESKPESVSDEYFSDDELLERGDDSIVVSESALGIFQQMDGLVSWSIENVSREKNGVMEQKSPWELRRDPPELVVKTQGENDSIVEFSMTLTQNVAEFAEDMFHQVNEAYKGKSFEKKEKKPSIFTSDGFAYHTQEAKDWVGTNPWKSLLFLFIIVMLFVTLW